MKALVLVEYNRLELEDIPRPEPGPHDVLVRVGACGICGSDVHGMDGSSGRRIPPVVMGHEASGTVAAVGAEVTQWHEGDRVTFDSTIYCGRCWYCRRGQINLCDQRRVLGVSCDEYRQHGAFAEYVVVPEHIVYRLPGEVSFVQAAAVEPLSVAVHAVHRAGVNLADSAVVVGAGTIGLMLLQALRAAGAGRLVAVDLDSQRLQLARQCGADDTLAADEQPLERLLSMTGGRGMDLAFEAVGVPATVDLATAAVRKGGRVVLVGNVTPEVGLHLQRIVTRELSLLGTCASQHDYPRCLELIARGAVVVDPLISAVAPLEEGPDWFRRLYDRTEPLLKVILQP